MKMFIRLIVFAVPVMILIVSLHVTATAQCPLSMTISYTPVDRLSVVDIDFQHFESRSLLFTMNISNTQPVAAYASLSIILHIQLADGATLPDPALTFATKPFLVPPGGRTITNLDIGRGASDIKDSVFDFPHEVKNQVQDVALGSGKFPAGVYTFNLELHQLGCVPVAATPIVFVLQNLSRLELRSPGDGETTNQFPLFEFFQDGSNAVLTIAEKSDDQSREDALAHKPPMLEVDLNNQNSFLYVGGRPLETGKTYVWGVASKQLGVGGPSSEIASPIWSFKVSSDASLSSNDAILNLLEQILGQQYAPVFEEIRSSGFKVSGHFDLNGSMLTQTDLMNLLNELRSMANNIELRLE